MELDIEEKWEWTCAKELLKLDHGDIKFEDYQDISMFCLEVLLYSRRQQVGKKKIAWHDKRIEEVKADRALLGKSRMTMLKSKRVIETERVVFDEFVEFYGNPENSLVRNIHSLGQ